MPKDTKIKLVGMSQKQIGSDDCGTFTIGPSMDSGPVGSSNISLTLKPAAV